MKMLKNVLLINAVSSGVTGLGLAAMPGFYARLFEVPANSAFVGTGLFLVAFAALVFSESRRSPLRPNWVWFIIALDTLWVLASLFILVTQALTISTLGYFLLAVVALWIALMAVLQYLGVRRLTVAS